VKNMKWDEFKKIKTMTFSKSGNVRCKVIMVQYWNKCHNTHNSSWRTEDRQCELDIKTRIAMEKDAFYEHKEIAKRKYQPAITEKMLCLFSFEVGLLI